MQVVDERMWGDEDKPEPDQKPGEEQRGKDAPAQVTGSESLQGRESWGVCLNANCSITKRVDSGG